MSTGTPTNRAYGTFGLAARSPEARRELALAGAIFAAVVLLGAQLTTQWVAHQLVYQPGLGAPVITTGLGPLYAPWGAAVWLLRLGGTPESQALAGQIKQLLVLFAVLATTASGAVALRRHRRRDNRASELHGSARWANLEDVRAAGLLEPEGVVVGRWEDQTTKRLRWLLSDGPEHLLLFAPTGSGKGVGPVLSTLLTWKHSIVVFDPKGENFELTSGWRSTFSPCYRLDFTADPESGSAFNPLAEVRIRSVREVSDVQRMALQLLSTKGSDAGSEASQYFINAGAELLAGAMLHVLYRESARGRVATLADVANELSDPMRTHTQMLQEWLEFPHDASLQQRWVDTTGARTATHPLVAKAARTQRNRDPRDRSPILSTVNAALALFCDPLLVANTSRSDFNIRDLVGAGQPITVYLVLRISDQDRLKPLIRLLLDLWIGRLTEDTVFSAVTSDAPSPPHRRRLLFLLDEFPILGKLSIIETALAAARGWGLKFFLIAQDYEQIVASYGKTESLLSNCGVRAAYATNKPQTAKLLSELAGTTTVVKENSTRSGPFGSPLAKNQSLSEQEVKRELVTPDECMRLPGPLKTAGTNPRIRKAGDMLVFVGGFPAIYAKQPLYFQDDTLQARARLEPTTPRPAAIVVAAPPPPPPPSAPSHEAVLPAPGAARAAATAAADIDDELLALAGIPEAEEDADDGGDADADDFDDGGFDSDSAPDAD